MDKIRREDLELLVWPRKGPCVSVYMPTHPVGREGQGDTARLSNLLEEAERELLSRGTSPSIVADLFEPVRHLPYDAVYWDERSEGLAVFVAPQFVKVYRLPEHFEEMAHVGESFLIRPLLPRLSHAGRFFILALSENRVRLFRAEQEGIVPIEAPELPVSMEETLNYIGVDRGEQVHAASSALRGKQGAVFHGQGGARESRKDDLENYFRVVDSGVSAVLQEEEAPLLLAGVGYLLPIYRGVNRYPHLAQAELKGNFDRSTPQEILERAKPLVEPELDKRGRALATRWEQARGTGKTATDLRSVLTAARIGSVEALMLRVGANQWGKDHADVEKIELHETRQAGDAELLDLAAGTTLRQGGEIYALDREEMPPGSELAAALLRY